MDPYKMEFDNSEINNMPEYIFTTYVKPFGIYTKKIEKSEISITGATDFDSNGMVTFEINSNQFLDPFSLYLVVDLVNDGENPLQLDGSAHSLIRNITVRKKENNVKIEEILNYNDIMNLFFELHLTRKERKERHLNEGFGYNEFGSNETIIYNENINKKPILTNEGLDSMDIDKNVKTDYFNNDDKNNIKKEVLWNITTEQDEFYNISEWNEALNGKLVPYKIEKIEDWNDQINYKRFKIPLYLKSIGHYMSDDNYKFIPLKILGTIQITIQFDPFGVFVPIFIPKTQYFKFIEKNNLSYIMPYITSKADRRFILRNVHLEYNLYNFNEKVENIIYKQVMSDNWCIDYTAIQRLNEYYFTSYPSIDVSGSFKDKTQIRAIYISIRTNLYQMNAFSRYFARHNKGINRIIFEYRNLYLPDAIDDRDRNSLTSIGQINGEYFWDQLSKAMNNNDSIITKGNFFMNHSLSESVALNKYSNDTNNIAKVNFTEMMTYLDPDWTKKYLSRARAIKLRNILLGEYGKNKSMNEIEDFKGNIPDFQNKSLFTINFDDMFNAKGRYRVGLKVNPEDKFKLIFHRMDGFENFDPYFDFRTIYSYIYIYAEYYETLFLDGKLGLYKEVQI
jgi:hypothetical protein